MISFCNIEAHLARKFRGSNVQAAAACTILGEVFGGMRYAIDMTSHRHRRAQRVLYEWRDDHVTIIRNMMSTLGLSQLVVRRLAWKVCVRPRNWLTFWN